MKDNNSPDSATSEIDAIRTRVDAFVAGEFDVILTNVCTEDGFVIHQSQNRSEGLEEDKMAAVSSALLSLAEASVNGIKGGSLERAIIESETVTVLVMRIQRPDKGLVVTVVASKKMSVGNAIYLTNRLAADLKDC